MDKLSDCLSLLIKSEQNKVVFDSLEDISIFDLFYINSSPFECRLKSCEIYQTNCEDKYTGKSISIAPKYPFELVSLDKKEWIEDVCIICKTSFDSPPI